jgi:1-phosphatidylinositol phosphodiesterase
MPSTLKSSLKVSVTSLILLLSLSEVSHAHNTRGYSHDGEAKTSNPGWMTSLKDDVRLSELSIPGTHDSMARLNGGDIAKTQSMPLPNQLESGVRVLDIRCRNIKDVFAIHHGSVFQGTYFGDVLATVVNFLKDHPGETVLMRVKEEYEAANNTKSFAEVFRERYWEPNETYMWQGTSSNPTLGDLRGKIVILQNFSASQTYGIPYDSFSIQDDYKLNSNWDLYDKWTKVKKQLAAANSGDSSTKYMNYLSGAQGGFPYFVASGHSNPSTGAPRLATGKTSPGWKGWRDFPRVNCALGICTIAFEGTNVLTYERLGDDYKNRVGIIMADFPGPGLIDRIIKLNNRFKK